MRARRSAWPAHQRCGRRTDWAHPGRGHRSHHARTSARIHASAAEPANTTPSLPRDPWWEHHHGTPTTERDITRTDLARARTLDTAPLLHTCRSGAPGHHRLALL